MKNGVYLFLVFLISCANNQTKKENQNKSDSLTSKSVSSSNQNNSDSLNDYRSYYYLSNISTKEFAELYLKDSIMTNDYKKLYDCLDSLSSNNLETRNYYSQILINALDKPEEVFHQNMGVYLVKNIDIFRNEFLVILSRMNDEEIKFYAQGIEIYLSQKQDKGEKWINDLKLLEKESTPNQLKKLDLFFNEIDLAKNSTIE